MNQSGPSDTRNRQIISLAGAFILGAVLIVASIGKVIDPIVFVEQIRKEGLDIGMSASTVALIALAVETALGFALLLGVRNRWVLVPSSGLVAFFLFLTGRTYWMVLTGQRDDTYDCGCFGVFLQRTATEAFWQDLFLLLPPLLMAFADRKARHRSPKPWKLAVSVLATVGILVYAVAAAGISTGPVPELEAVNPDSGAFRPSTQFVLVVNGTEDPDGKILESDETLEFLLISSRLPAPVILNVHRSKVFRVGNLPAGAGESEALRLPSDVTQAEVGTFEVSGSGLSFEFEGLSVLLRSRGA